MKSGAQGRLGTIKPDELPDSPGDPGLSALGTWPTLFLTVGGWETPSTPTGVTGQAAFVPAAGTCGTACTSPRILPSPVTGGSGCTRFHYGGTVNRILGRRNLGGSTQRRVLLGAMALLLSDSSLLRVRAETLPVQIWSRALGGRTAQVGLCKKWMLGLERWSTRWLRALLLSQKTWV